MKLTGVMVDYCIEMRGILQRICSKHCPAPLPDVDSKLTHPLVIRNTKVPKGYNGMDKMIFNEIHWDRYPRKKDLAWEINERLAGVLGNAGSMEIAAHLKA